MKDWMYLYILLMVNLSFSSDLALENKPDSSEIEKTKNQSSYSGDLITTFIKNFEFYQILPKISQKPENSQACSFKIEIFRFAENSVDVGYYHDPNWNDLIGFAFNLSHSEDPNSCFNMCEKKGFEYASIKYIINLERYESHSSKFLVLIVQNFHHKGDIFWNKIH
ncbi:hypothetical protein BpHYR1_031185 [Brachionus plicatilis]|uniref:Secreted protein n=1 Tax=Brachionus plicatilis TaxID=10195 RepID=A0A3M7R1N4_BRAPC|nr:hypothetical protein BpHYR1_031185 [Brachionus plicatilis]